MKDKSKQKAPKAPKIKTKKEKKPGRDKTAIAVVALVLAVLGIGAGGYFGWRFYKQAKALEADSSSIGKKVAALEEAAALEKNRESVVIQMAPHSLAAYMSDSAHLYTTRFSGVRYDSAETESNVKLRVPVTVTIHNTCEQTITVTGAALYPWETIFEETARQETLAAKQAKGFFGELAQGQRDSFSIAPGESASIEIDARLRGVYGHPAMEAELHRFFMDYFGDPERTAPGPDGDVAVKGKGTVNGQVTYLFCDALNFYCARRSTRFTLTYAIQTARGNSFSATCAVPF